MKEYLFKILVVGDLGTGKTSIIKRYVHNIFSMNYKSTIGVDFALKVLQYSPEVTVRIQCWDIAGQERFGNMTRVYYKEAVGALVVYDVTRSSTFDGVTKWKSDLDDKVRLADGETRLPVILLANKVDLAREAVDREMLQQFCEEKGFVGFYETSAKENENIGDAMRHLISKIIENDKVMTEKGVFLKSQSRSGKQQSSTIRIQAGSSGNNNSSGSGCC